MSEACCDLHMHSVVSDGSLEVSVLVRQVAEAGVSAFSLTDHDSVDGLAEARREAEQVGLRFVSGVEISTEYDGVELHLLAYAFDETDPEFVQFLSALGSARRARVQTICDRLCALGIELSVEQVYRCCPHQTPGRPHVARALVEAGHCRDVEQAFVRYLGDGGVANVRKQVAPVAEAIRLVHAAGGKCVWAHPLARPVRRPGGFDRMLRELAAIGLDGVEQVHPAQNPSERRRISKAVRSLGLLWTGGSDFHGEATPGVRLGVGRGGDRVPVHVFESLLA